MPNTPAAAALAAMLAATPLAAADPEGRYAVEGVGARPCSDLIRAQAEDPQLVVAFAGWTAGFLTALNVTQPGTYDLTPFEPTEFVLAKLAKYCEANPQEPFVNAMGRYAAAQGPRRLVEYSPLVRVQSGTHGVFIYASLLEDVRARLIAEGLTPPVEAGSFDGRFAEALGRFQQAQGLPVSGLPDLATLNALYP